MKKSTLWIALSVLTIGAGCSKETPEILNKPIDTIDESVDDTLQNEDSIQAKKFVGTWVEKYPGLYDNFPDTLVFTEDFKIEKHVILQNNIYYVEKDTLFFYNPERGVQLRHQFAFISDKEVYFPSFIHSSTTTMDKPTYFIKIDEDL